MKRERYWGLYSLRDKTWRSAGSPHTSPVAFQQRPIKRDRYHSFQAAIEGAESWKTDPREIVPRSFYVVRRPVVIGGQTHLALNIINTARRLCEPMGKHTQAYGALCVAVAEYDKAAGR